ncbi:outer membrane beta-barrel protein [Pedobacter foliorum]|uniref:outer membrane beta-barrel protein n=1 Tax=Pedobacter foliorum TaxID=2739058 RepID=UPI0015637033|nr:outer membrane beta-barrel protein [Pedobacter foliorum]NRF37225.1 outer membrane beta-barrel protein [Pedobacter foliorum]
MEHTDKGLEVIKSLLQNNEEAYREGSWESFSKQKPTKNKPVGWLWISGIAASLLLIGLVFLWSDNPQPKQAQLAEIKVKPVQQKAKDETPLFKSYKVKEKPSVKSLAAGIPTEQYKAEPEPQNTTIAQTTPKQDRSDANPTTRKENRTAYPFYPQPENNTKKHTTTADNWMLGMAMATDFSNSKKVGLAVEAVVGYALNPKITIMLGAGYRQTSAFKENDGQTLSASNEKQLESAAVRLTGIEVPLALRYNLNKRVYAKVGVSAFATIKQSGELTYLSSVSHIESIVDPNGEVSDKTVISEVRSVVDLEDESRDKGSYKSFINISFGYRYPLLKNKTITLEPFIKLPMQSSKIENVKLSSAGLRLGIDF